MRLLRPGKRSTEAEDGEEEEEVRSGLSQRESTKQRIRV